MSASATGQAPAQRHDPNVSHQFETLEQQNESYVVGMWAFLTTEIMFFGSVFLIYLVYRFRFHEAFFKAHHHLDLRLGLTNTFILLFSSLTMALAVHFAQLQKRRAQITCLLATMGLALGFVCIKAVEYSHKFQHHLYPNATFRFEDASIFTQAKLFFSLYFGATSLHALHVVIGVGLIAWMVIRALRHKQGRLDFVPVEMVGLYWHFVDIVWIFLFPLLYLIPR